MQIWSSSSHWSQRSSQGIEHGTRKKEKEERTQKPDHQKKSLIPRRNTQFTSAVKPRMGGGASCHGQDRRMHISAMAMLHYCVMELKESFLTQSCVTIVCNKKKTH